MGAIHLAQFGKAVGAQVNHLVHPEAITEIRYLQHHRFNIQGDAARAIHYVLVRAGNQALGRVYVIAEHRQAIDRCHRYDPVHQAGLREILEGLAAVEDIGHWPTPEIRFARHHAHIGLCDFSACYRAGDSGIGGVSRRCQQCRGGERQRDEGVAKG
ncbi:hypothetical protein D3C75_1005730 [compost metagenome]